MSDRESIEDAELTRLLHSAFPEAVPTGLTSRQEQLVARAIADVGESQSKTRTQPRWVSLQVAASIAIVLTVTAAMLLVFLRPPTAVAATPPPLEAVPVEGTAQELLGPIATSVRAHGLEADRTIQLQQWALSYDADSDEPPTMITPERIEVSLPSPEKTVRRAWATQSYDSRGNLIANPDVPVGTFLWETEMDTAAAQAIFPLEPPTRASEYGAYFGSTGLIGEGIAAEYLGATANLLSSRSLSSAQEAALIEFLATLPDLEVAGETTDRLGRAGLMITAAGRHSDEYVDVIVLSATGGILSTEWQYHGTSRTDIASPAVLSYTAWETKGNE